MFSVFNDLSRPRPGSIVTSSTTNKQVSLSRKLRDRVSTEVAEMCQKMGNPPMRHTGSRALSMADRSVSTDTPRKIYYRFPADECLFCGYRFVIVQKLPDGTTISKKRYDHKVKLSYERITKIQGCVPNFLDGGFACVCLNEGHGICRPCNTKVNRILKIRTEEEDLTKTLVTNYQRPCTLMLQSPRKFKVQKRGHVTSPASTSIKRHETVGRSPFRPLVVKNVINILPMTEYLATKALVSKQDEAIHGSLQRVSKTTSRKNLTHAFGDAPRSSQASVSQMDDVIGPIDMTDTGPKSGDPYTSSSSVECQVILHYPSGTKTKVVRDEVDVKIAKAIFRNDTGKAKSLVGILAKNYPESVVDAASDIIAAESKRFAKQADNVLKQITYKDFLCFSWDKLHAQFSKEAPLLLSIISAAAGRRNTPGHLTKVLLCLGLVLRLRNNRLSLLSYIIGFILQRGGCTVKDITRMCKLGPSVAPSTITTNLKSWEQHSGGSVRQLLHVWKESLLNGFGNPLRYQLVGDNWDKDILPSYRTSKSETQSIHLFQMAVIVDRVSTEAVGGPFHTAPGETDTGPRHAAPADTAPADTGSADNVPGDTGPADTGPADTGPRHAAPADTAPSDTGPADTGPRHAAPADTGPGHAAPVVIGPADTGPADTGPRHAAPADTAPADTGPADTGPRHAAPADTGPGHAAPVVIGPGDTGPRHAAPADIGPRHAAPVVIGPCDTGPRHAAPADTGPRHAAPVVIGPGDTGPRHASPADTGPRHAAPADTGPRHAAPVVIGPGDTGPKHAAPADTGPRHAAPADTGPRHAAPDVIGPHNAAGGTTVYISNEQFIPSVAEQKTLKGELTFHVATVLIQNIPCLQKMFSGIYPNHLTHKYSHICGSKTTQYPIGLYDCNEHYTTDVVKLLQELSAEYLPRDQETILEQVFFGGDRLSDERVQGAQEAMKNAASPYERLEGFISKIEDFHRLMNFLEAIYKLTYRSDSANDVGTACYVRNLLDKRDVKGKVKNYYRPYKILYYTIFEAICCALCFIMLGLDGSEEWDNKSILPPEFGGKTEEKISWLNKLSSRLVTKYIFEEKEDMFEKVREVLQDPSHEENYWMPDEHNNYVCHFCNKTYKILDSAKAHEKRVHSFQQEKPKKSSTQVDDELRNQLVLLFKLVALHKNLDTAVDMGDGARVVRSATYETTIYN